MLVKDILRECLAKMGEEDFTDKPAADRTDAEKVLAAKLVSALNTAYREAVSGYLPLIAEESVTAADGYIPASSLARAIVYPVSLVTAAGEKCRLRSAPDGVATDLNGTGVLRYAYLPEDADESGEIEDMRLTVSVLSDGVLAELYYRDKVFDIAESYDSDFRAALGALRYKGREMRLGAGRR